MIFLRGKILLPLLFCFESFRFDWFLPPLMFMDYEKLYYFPADCYKFYIHGCFKTLYFTGKVVNLSRFTYHSSFNGRYTGVFILVILQFLVGAIHTVISFFIIFVMSGVLIYSIYTFFFGGGFFTIVFLYGLWVNIKSG